MLEKQKMHGMKHTPHNNSHSIQKKKKHIVVVQRRVNDEALYCAFHASTQNEGNRPDYLPSVLGLTLSRNLE